MGERATEGHAAVKSWGAGAKRAAVARSRAMRIGALCALLAVLPLGARAAPDAGQDAAGFAQAVAAAHELADRLAMSDPAAGARELEAVIETPFPPSEGSRELRLELFAHIAELHLAAHDPAKALAAARRGIAEDTKREPDSLSTQLLLREAEALEASGDGAGAVRSYSKAIAISRRLLAGSESKVKERAP
jgi:tetratricopeptide (TPR) repeat protein